MGPFFTVIQFTFCSVLLKSDRLVVGNTKAFLLGKSIALDGHTHSEYATIEYVNRAINTANGNVTYTFDASWTDKAFGLNYDNKTIDDEDYCYYYSDKITLTTLDFSSIIDYTPSQIAISCNNFQIPCRIDDRGSYSSGFGAYTASFTYTGEKYTMGGSSIYKEYETNMDGYRIWCQLWFGVASSTIYVVAKEGVDKVESSVWVNDTSPYNSFQSGSGTITFTFIK